MLRKSTQIRALLAGALACALGNSLTACAAPPPETAVGIGVVVGNRANSPAVVYDDVSPMLDAGMTKVAGQQVAALQVTFAESDGNPAVQPPITHDEPLELGDRDLEARRADTRRAFEQMFAQTTSQDAEAAPLDAIARTAEVLRAAPNIEIHVFDSGIGTAGLLPLTEGRLDEDPQAAAARLRDAGLLPGLEGVHIVWHGLGTVAGAQEKPDELALTKLRALWSTVLESAGATVSFEPARASDPPSDALPRVTAVHLPVYTPPIVEACQTSLDADTVSFRPDLPEFVNRPDAERAARAVADGLKGCSGCPTVTGTTASDGDEAWLLELSRQRAQAFAALLREAGVTCDIRTDGVGTHFAGFQPDHDEHGALIESVAAQNRRVLISMA